MFWIDSDRFAVTEGSRLHLTKLMAVRTKPPPPGSTHEVDGPPRFYPIPSYVLPLLADLSRFRPPPPPFGDVPPPSEADPIRIPAPTGIRAVYPAAAMLFRSRPETNHPVRRIPPIRLPGNRRP